MSLSVIIINQETTQSARENGLPDLWHRAQSDQKLSMILISPEQLKSKDYASALANPSFYRRIYALSVDEVHLLLTWGKSFRQPFRQIGLARSRLPDDTVLIALTATMRGGQALRLRFCGETDMKTSIRSDSMLGLLDSLRDTDLSCKGAK